MDNRYEITLNGEHSIIIYATNSYEALDIAELELEDYTTDDDDQWTIRRVS